MTKNALRASASTASASPAERSHLPRVAVRFPPGVMPPLPVETMLES